MLIHHGKKPKGDGCMRNRAGLRLPVEDIEDVQDVEDIDTVATLLCGRTCYVAARRIVTHQTTAVSKGARQDASDKAKRREQEVEKMGA